MKANLNADLNLETNRNHAFHFFVCRSSQPEVQILPQPGEGSLKVLGGGANCVFEQVALHATDKARAGGAVSIMQLLEVLHNPCIKNDAKLRQHADPIIDAWICWQSWRRWPPGH
jgi:hypothetical protein